ncbi:MAG: DNA methyltransferase [Helicobacter sp.]|uniref:site-specific DNA-methyltransferase n=1 Tax=Helicobacter sp. TaxID=218 RepID=UPI002A909A4E|nr:DNA methyltransferase [Helicobacter sp.]MDY5616156.1 DNA methyltransferase [Helicobacter sp.]
MDHKQAFFSQLESMYLGVQIEDTQNLFNTDKIQKSGFINLLKIKSQYFKTIKEKLEKEEVKYPIYNKLYNFFGSYLNETGTPFFYDTPLHKNIYARVYTNSKDTSLFYKTQNLYYVKSDAIYHNAEIKSEDSSYTFIFDTSYFTPNSDNAKNKAIFKFKIDEEIRIYVLNNKEELQDLPNVFKQNSSDLSDEFIKALKDKQIRLQEEEIKKILYAYKKQNEVDFFIHKNARAFLQEQFNLWMFKYVVDDITDWSKDKIDELNQLKKIAFRIIDFIADFEDELKAIWCKPKFAKNVHYVFSLDTISNHARDSEQILESIFQDTGFKQQIKEWQELKLIDEHFEIKNINDEQYKFLPLDTKYLSEENYYKLLCAFDNLDEILHGELIKSDNFQALNSLMPKYQDKIDLIYIDPPFNTGSDFEYKDRFQDSTWLSLMHNRLELAKEFLSDRGSFYLHLDHNANYRGRELLNEVFGEENFRNEIIWRRKQGTLGQTRQYGIVTDILFFYTKTEFYDFKYELQKDNKEYLKRFKYKDDNGRLYRLSPLVSPSYSPTLIYDYKGYKPPKNGWSVSYQTMQQYEKENKLKFPKDKNGRIERKQYLDEWEGTPIQNLWDDIFVINPVSSERIEAESNLTQKPEALLRRIIKASSNEDSIVFDYHLGSGTTIATAHKLGRKWLGVEMGEHFYKVVIPRMKKVISGFASGISKEVEFKGGGAFRYYELESYEESLENCEYILSSDNAEVLSMNFEGCQGGGEGSLLDANDRTDNADSFKICDKTTHLIDYRKSRKLIKGLKKGEKICLDMSKYNKNFDIFTTMSNLLGLKIKSIFLDENGIQSCKFENDDVVNLETIDLIKYPKLRNLIWWEK